MVHSLRQIYRVFLQIFQFLRIWIGLLVNSKQCKTFPKTSLIVLVSDYFEKTGLVLKIRIMFLRKYWDSFLSFDEKNNIYVKCSKD